MVWKNLYRLDTIRGLRFDPRRALLEDEPFDVLVSGRATKIIYIPKELYFYRKRSVPTSLCKQKDFLERQLRGRLLCLDYSKNLNPDITLIVSAQYIQTLLTIHKNSPVKNINFSRYHNLVREAHSKGLLNTKYYILFRIFEKHPIITSIYRQIRLLLKKQRTGSKRITKPLNQTSQDK